MTLSLTQASDRPRPPRLLAVSPPCVTAVNRAVYRHLAERFGVNVHLVVPAYCNAGKSRIPCQPTAEEPIPVTQLEPSGSHPRVLRLDGLEDVIARLKPTHVLIDGDPATRLVLEVIRCVHGTGTKIWVLTCENFERRYLREAAGRLARGRLPQAFGSVLTWAMLRRVRHRIHHVFTISRDGTRALTSLGFEGRVTQVPIGFDPELFRPQDDEIVAATRRQLGLTARTVAYIGRLVPEKGVDVLLKTLATLKDLEWQLLIDKFDTYSSPFVRMLDQLVNSLGIQDRVVYFDATHENMPNYMNAADIIALPSVSGRTIKEQYGRVVPEAMACGKVVVGSTSGTIPELIGDAGFVFPAGDRPALARLLCQLLTASEGDLIAIRSRAIRRAHDQFSICQQAEIWAAMLQEGKSEPVEIQPQNHPAMSVACET